MKNTVSHWVCCLVTAVVVTGLMAPEAVAEVSKEAREIHHMQAQLSAAQREKAELASQVDDLKKQIGELGSKSAALEKKAGGQRKQFAELTEKYQETERDLQQMTQQYSETNRALQQVRKEKEQEQMRLSGDIQACEMKNAELFRISMELMDKYQSKGVFTSLLQAEPFTQLEKVKIQNLLQEYKDKADAAKITHAKLPVSVTVNNTAASASGSLPVGTPSGAEPVPDDAQERIQETAPTGVAPANVPSNTPGSGIAAGSTIPTVSNKEQDAVRP